MSGSSRTLNRSRRLELVLLLAFAVFLRVLGPTIALPERTGFAALCTGSDIVYLPSTPDGGTHPDGDDGGDLAPQHMSCIWLAHHLAIVPAVLATAIMTGRAPAPDLVQQGILRLSGGSGAYRSRAPPAPIP